jgi:dihydroorotate dehydrogenase electron transfer subunit
MASAVDTSLLIVRLVSGRFTSIFVVMAQPHRDQFQATVVHNTVLCREHYRLVMRIGGFPPTEPGVFVQLACRDMAGDYAVEHERSWTDGQRPGFDGPELMAPLAMLRRPFSLAGRRDSTEGVEMEVIHRVVGVGTDWLSRLRPGDQVDVLGPLGNHFTLPEEDQVAILIGGGVGIPPMIYLASRLEGRKAVVFSGAVTRELLPLTVTADAPTPRSDSIAPLYNIQEFARHGIPAVITTDDGSYGFRGFVTQALERYLDRYFTAKAIRPLLYTCGPEPMMKRVADIAAARNIQCQIAVERAMACGMGTCQSCCIRVKKPDPSKPPLVGKDWCYRLACTDGPVFRGSDLLW